MQKYYFKCDNCGYTSLNKFNFCPKCEEGTGIRINKPLNKNIINSKNINCKKVSDYNEEELELYNTGFKEINECLGGGIVKNSIILLSGAPGVGKSTFLLELINNLSKNHQCAYIISEETGSQVKKRYKRLKLTSDFYLEHLSSIQEIELKTKNSDIIIIDSINTIYDEENNNILGGVSQIKNNIFRLLEYAKKYNKTIIVVGQITKDGSIAGPKTLEHMVDVSLYFDYFGDNSNYRILKNNKNRFGNNNNIAILKMDETGIKPVKDYSQIFLSKDNDKTPGTVYSVILEGSKPIFVEVQSLVVDSKSDKNIIQSVGYDTKRLFQLIAVLQQNNIKLYNKNIFINIAGGLKINDPIIDLGVFASLYEQYKNFKYFKNSIFIGEIGLNGKILKKQNEEIIVKESKKYFKKVYSRTTGYTHIQDIFIY